MHVRPDIAKQNVRHEGLTDANFVGDGLLCAASFALCPDEPDALRRQFTGHVALFRGVHQILRTSHPFKVFYAWVAAIVIDVVNLVAGRWARRQERFGDQNMQVAVRAARTVEQRHEGITSATDARLQYVADASPVGGLLASNAAAIRDTVNAFPSGNGTPRFRDRIAAHRKDSIMRGAML